MKRTNCIGHLFAVLVVAVCGAGPAWSAGVSPSIIASRTTCVAPCFVYFDARNSDSDGNGVRGEWVADLVDANFAWDFDDPAAAGKKWPYGARATTAVDGLSMNQDLGFVAGHVFEQPGTYTATLTVTNKNGNAGTDSETIRVAAWADSANGPTYCFSTSGNFAGCPAGANHITTNDFDIALLTNCAVTSRAARCLFRGGETFIQDRYIGGLHGGPGIIASGDFYGFGSGRATISTTSANANAIGLASDWRMFGFKIDGNNSANTAFTATRPNDALIWNNEITRFTYNGIDELGTHTGMVGNYIHDMGQYCAIGRLNEGGMLGNYCLRASQATKQHGFRSEWYTGSAIAHNKVEQWGNDAWKINSHCTDGTNCTGFDPAKLDQYLWIYDNYCVENSGNAECLSIGPQYTGANEPVARVLIDGLLYQPKTGTTAQNGFAISLKNVNQAVVRNCTMQLTQYKGGVEVLDYSPIAGPPTDNRVVGNSFWVPGSFDSYGAAVNRSSTSRNVLIANNLLYATGGTAPVSGCGGSSSCTQAGNLRVTAKPFSGSSPLAQDDFKLAAGASNVIDHGASSPDLVLDAFGGSRIGQVPDVGANEYGSQPLGSPQATSPPPPPILLGSQ